jgi:hypothetical protein
VSLINLTFTNRYYYGFRTNPAQLKVLLITDNAVRRMNAKLLYMPLQVLERLRCCLDAASLQSPTSTNRYFHSLRHGLAKIFDYSTATARSNDRPAMLELSPILSKLPNNTIIAPLTWPPRLSCFTWLRLLRNNRFGNRSEDSYFRRIATIAQLMALAIILKDLSAFCYIGNWNAKGDFDGIVQQVACWM